MNTVEIKHDMRSIHSAGASSKVITLPMQWIDRYKIANGTDVHIMYGSFILIIPPDTDIEERMEIEKMLRELELRKNRRSRT